VGGGIANEGAVILRDVVVRGNDGTRPRARRRSSWPAALAARLVAGSLWGAEHGASRIPGPARVPVDLSAVIEEITDALVLGQRQWNLGQQLEPAGWKPV
jgi:hypothetical protein